MAKALLIASLSCLAACTGATVEEVSRNFGPADPRPGACYARGITPAVLETVTSQVQEVPAVRHPDGTILSPARFRTVTSTRIVQDRGENWFETPCPLRDRDPVFVQQIQRALQVRGLYGGEINGFYDVPTRAAVQAFQTPLGLESGTLSNESAKALGLVALGRGA
ncbi:peptidoglycan-binding protein [Jannaschia sp. M317]|uniref:peptidoglycan-binding domain-containing protein n=1 Tax=Jannaschia sp. M317 TaxID=2867011 RepID=UPI0021A4EA88|nr:peptidoglycan-binding domain-containing protein [Jannaschia sp. M317]UWQ18669.1 peptidoglycan-binding protein [Jannaschia sp. M317]